MAKTRMKQNDTAPPFTATLKDGLGAVTNLTGATLKFLMRNRRTKAVKVNAVATVVSAALGTVSYAWAATDLDTVGVYDVEIEVTFSDATVETFPTGSFHELTVLDDIA